MTGMTAASVIAVDLHTDVVNRVSWSPSGKRLATASHDGTVAIWNRLANRIDERLTSPGGRAWTVSWSPGETRLATVDDEGLRVWTLGTKSWGEPLPKQHKARCARYAHHDTLAIGCENGTIVLLGSQNQPLRIFPGHVAPVDAVVWSPDGRLLASGARDGTVHIWDAEAGIVLHALHNHRDMVRSVVFSRSGQIVATASNDCTIRLNSARGVELRVLETHKSGVVDLSFSAGDVLFASRSWDDTLQIWRCDEWQPIEELHVRASPLALSGLAFHPEDLLLAAHDDREMKLHLWQMDVDRMSADRRSLRYTNAKVVLAGDTTVGKTGLRLALLGLPYRPVDSSHGRYVATMNYEYSRDAGGNDRELLLWDLAGNPGYRVVNQLHLDQVAVAVVVFDAGSDRDPFSGVSYWAKALDRAAAHRPFPLVKLLVAGRIDRGRPAVSETQIESIRRRLGFDDYFETSAAEGTGVDALREAIQRAVPWGQISTITTPRAFREVRQEIRAFRDIAAEGAIVERETIVKSVLAHHPELDRDEILTALNSLATVDVVRELSIGDLLLVQPEILDTYCASVALAARADPRGLGFILESRILNDESVTGAARRMANRKHDTRMLLATIQELVDREIALRVQTESGVEIGFPSEGTRDEPPASELHVPELAFTFEGPVAAIFATLAVRLTNSLAFGGADIYKDMALFKTSDKQLCGVAVRYPDALDDGVGRLEIFFGPSVDKNTKLLFLRYVNYQLENLAAAGTVKRERIYTHCELRIDDRAVRRRLSILTTRTVVCPVCKEELPADDLEENANQFDASVAAIGELAREENKRQSRLVQIEQRERAGNYDVFICHSSADNGVAKLLCENLRKFGILPWCDMEDLTPGTAYIRRLDDILSKCPAAIILIGKRWGRFQQREYEVLVKRHIDRAVLLLPILLPGADEGSLPALLGALGRIDCRDGSIDGEENLRLLTQTILNPASPAP